MRWKEIFSHLSARLLEAPDFLKRSSDWWWRSSSINQKQKAKVASGKFQSVQD